jgi:hypothetical protein
METFETYCQSKKIDPVAFKVKESLLFETLAQRFNLMHPSSFTAQKLFLINQLRRKYLFVATETETPQEQKSVPSENKELEIPHVVAKPKIGMPKMAIIPKTDVAETSLNVAIKPSLKPIIKPKLPSTSNLEDDTVNSQKTQPNLTKPIMARPIIEKPVTDEEKVSLENLEAPKKAPNLALKPKIPIKKKE